RHSFPTRRSSDLPGQTTYQTLRLKRNQQYKPHATHTHAHAHGHTHTHTHTHGHTHTHTHTHRPVCQRVRHELCTNMRYTHTHTHYIAGVCVCLQLLRA